MTIIHRPPSLLRSAAAIVLYCWVWAMLFVTALVLLIDAARSAEPASCPSVAHLAHAFAAGATPVSVIVIDEHRALVWLPLRNDETVRGLKFTIGPDCAPTLDPLDEAGLGQFLRGFGVPA